MKDFSPPAATPRLHPDTPLSGEAASICEILNSSALDLMEKSERLSLASEDYVQTTDRFFLF